MTETALWWTLIFIAIGHAVSSLELLAARRLFCPDDRCGWQILKRKFSPKMGLLLTPLFEYQGVRILLVVRLVSALWLLLVPTSWTPLLLVSVCTFLWQLRNRPWIMDAGDIFLMTSTMSVLLAGFPCHSPLKSEPLVLRVTLLFIAAQACLSYVVAGFYKVRGGWGGGRFLSELLDCELLVSRDHANALGRHPSLLKFMEISVVGLQLSAPGIFFLGLPFARLYVAWSILFHLLGSWGLGLRTFSFAYLTSYPAILWCAANFP